MDMSLGVRKARGDVVAGYELGAVIGIGTYGEVRCARNITTNQRVAVKIVELTRCRDDARALIENEVRAAHSAGRRRPASWAPVRRCVCVFAWCASVHSRRCTCCRR